MARRRRSTDEGQGSLDSLLDTMTNVVGILIMVLIVTQVNVSSVAKRIRANLPDVSEAQLAALVAKDEDVQKRIEDLKKPQQVSPQELEEARTEMDRLLAERDAVREEALAVVELEQALEDLEREVRAAERKNEKDGAELAQIRRDLEDGKAILGERKARLIRLPNPRTPEKGAQEVRLIVRKGRILHFDRQAILDRVAKRVKDSKKLPKEGNRYERKSLRDFLNGLREMDPDFRLEFVIHPNGGVRMSCFPRDDRGEDADEVRAKKGKALRKIAQAFEENSYIRFLVTADSFALYLLARERAERVQIPVGWLFVDDAAKQDLSLGERGIVATMEDGYEPPPPAPKPPGPAPEKKPPPVDDILD